MNNNEMKMLYEFTIFEEREVDETTSRIENEKTITETVKVKKKTPLYFGFKKPSRYERELAEEERAMWWSKYVEKGILPEALLLKLYSNYGGILSDDQKKYYQNLQTELLIAMEDAEEARINDKENVIKHKELNDKIVGLRDAVMDFQKEQAVFFDNTAEAKSRAKLIDYLTVHMSYIKTDTNMPWHEFFAGSTTEEKLLNLEKLEEEQSQIYLKARDSLMFIASIYVASNGRASEDTIKSLINQV